MARYQKKKYGRPMRKRRPRRKIMRKRRTRRKLPLTGMPKSNMVRLRYAQEFQLNAGVGTGDYKVFRANDLYDPDFTGTGHQPNGFDQLMLWYDHFTVVGSKATIKFTPTTGNNIAPGYVDLLLTDDPTTVASYTSVNDFLESRQGSGRALMAGTERNYFGVSPYHTKTFSAKRFFGTKNIMGNGLYRGNTTGSPTEQAFFIPIMFSAAGNDPAPMNFTIVIDYIAILSEPKWIGGS